MTSKMLKLYDNPVSFSSQVVRFALAEKGLPFQEHLMDVGPALQNYDPWYIKLNMRGVVPTLVDDGRVVCDSLRITRYLENVSKDAPLFPTDSDQRDQVEDWLDAFETVPERILPYIALEGGEKRFLMWDLGRRKRVLKYLAKSQKAFRRAYQDKLSDMEKLSAELQLPDIKDKTLTDVRDFLADTERRLAGGQAYLFGDHFTVADAVLGVYLARLGLLKLDGLYKNDAHTHLQSWYERVQTRPAFSEAHIGMSAKGSRLLLSLARAYFPAVVLWAFLAYTLYSFYS